MTTLPTWPVPSLTSTGDYTFDSDALESSIGGPLYSKQSQLSLLPVPPLEATLTKLKESVKAQCQTEEDWERVKEKINRFEREGGRTLQKRLEKVSFGASLGECRNCGVMLTLDATSLRNNGHRRGEETRMVVLINDTRRPRAALGVRLLLRRGTQPARCFVAILVGCFSAFDDSPAASSWSFENSSLFFN